MPVRGLYSLVSALVKDELLERLILDRVLDWHVSGAEEDGTRYAKSLAYLLGRNRTLRELSLRQCRFGRSAGDILGHAMLHATLELMDMREVDAVPHAYLPEIRRRNPDMQVLVHSEPARKPPVPLGETLAFAASGHLASHDSMCT